MKVVTEIDCANRRVLYRPDYNVPLKGGVIQDDFRIKATFPTINYLIEQGAKIIIAAHLGRPEGQPNPEFELRPVAEYLADIYTEHAVFLAHDIEGKEVELAIEQMQAGDILLLPNVRFYPGEESNDPEFAQKLASLAEVYVNDAFACDHRAHASVSAVAALLPHAAGFLLQKEVVTLGSLLEKPEHPFVVIMGGAKVSDKIEVIDALGKQSDTLLIGGAMANTFLLAQGQDIGESKAEPDKVEVAASLLENLKEKIIVAKDFVKDTDKEGSAFKYLDIGEGAVEEFKKVLSSAKTVFWNGSLGYTEDEKFAKGSKAIAEYLAGLTDVTTVIAGGDTVEMITRLDLHEKIGFVSTGGGAALEFLAGHELPGVSVLAE